jgi:hypothetical protein
LTYYFNKKLEEQRVRKFIISREKQDSIRKQGSDFKLTLSYDSFRNLRRQVSKLTSQAKTERSLFIDNFFAESFPRRYKARKISPKTRAKSITSALDESLIQHIDSEGQERVYSFIEAFLKEQNQGSRNKKKLFSAAKIRVDEIAISQVLNEFETLLSSAPNESKWGDFLEKNLYLLDSKYVSIIPELNVVLSGARKVDFGLVDSFGFLDIYEIKKPSTKLFSTATDRNNYVWHTDTVKAIVQAEKYLYNAERKASSLTEDIKRENNIEVSVIKPRAFLISGHSSQLDNEKKKEDFRILRMSLKNIDIILYDELFDRLANQRNKIYIE